MKYLFLSDLHLGNPLFECTHELINLLDSGKFDEIVLVGDILDSWENDIDDIYTDNDMLMESINMASLKIPTTYIIGNHDPDIGDIKKVFPQADICESYTIDGGIVVHGHEFDILMTKFSIVARIWSALSWITERVFRFSLNNWMRRLSLTIASKKNKSYYGDLITEVGKATVDTYRNKYTFAILGHTHYPIIEEVDGFTYVNCGDLIHSYTYATYDSRGKKFELHKIK